MKKLSSKAKYYLITLVSVALLIVFDQWSKIWAVKTLYDGETPKPIVLIKGIFEFEHLKNDGAAFSSFSGKQTFLLILTSAILLVAVVELIRIPASRKYNWLRFGFILLVSGAVGNMIDRFRQGYVDDFLHFVPFNFPTFNVADCYITVSAFIICILLLFVYKDEDSAFLFEFRKKKSNSEDDKTEES